MMSEKYEKRVAGMERIARECGNSPVARVPTSGNQGKSRQIKGNLALRICGVEAKNGGKKIGNRFFCLHLFAFFFGRGLGGQQPVSAILTFA